MKTTVFSANHALEAILQLPDTQQPAPGIVFCNGYAATKEMFIEMAAYFNRHGYATLQFDYRGTHGENKGRLLCGTEWLEDVDSAISYLGSEPGVDKNRIGLAGVSMGGGLTVIQTALDHRIKCAYVMAPCATAYGMMEERWIRNRGEAQWNEFLKEIEEDNVNRARGHQSKILSTAYASGEAMVDTTNLMEAAQDNPDAITAIPLESIDNSLKYFNPLSLAGQIQIPVFYIHGDADFTVPYHWSEQLYAQTNSEKRLHIIPGASHVLPECEHRKEVFDLGLEWFDKYL